MEVGNLPKAACMAFAGRDRAAVSPPHALELIDKTGVWEGMSVWGGSWPFLQHPFHCVVKTVC